MAVYPDKVTRDPDPVYEEVLRARAAALTIEAQAARPDGFFGSAAATAVAVVAKSTRANDVALLGRALLDVEAAVMDKVRDLAIKGAGEKEALHGICSSSATATRSCSAVRLSSRRSICAATTRPSPWTTTSPSSAGAPPATARS